MKDTFKRHIHGFVWKYGNRYAKSIKKIPVVRAMAEKYFWRLSGLEMHPGAERNTMHRDLLYLGDYRALTRTVFGHKMFVDTRDISIAPHLCLDGQWEPQITKVFLETLQEGMNVLEVGANIGYYTVLAATRIGKSGKIYSFEANPEIFEILLHNIAVNGLLERAELINKAVSNKSGTIKFHTLNRLRGASNITGFSQEILNKYGDEVKVIEVEALSLDEYFNNKDVGIDVIKIDAEGSEALILKGMRKLLAHNPHITIISEFAPSFISATGEDPAQFLEEIMSLGFKLKVIGPGSELRETSVDELLAMAGTNICELFLAR